MLGLTGGIASGKSTVSARLRQLGAFVADADEAARAVMDEPQVLRKVRERFGDGVFYEDGRLDRRALAKLAFATEQGTADLNAITHPAVKKQLLDSANQAENSGRYPLVVLDVPLLIESGMHEYCSGVWLVTAHRSTRIKRIIKRDGVTRAEARQRIKRQMSDRKKARFATVILKNNGTLQELLSAVDRAFYAEVNKNNGVDDER